MANTFKLKTKADVGITTTNVYVVPTNTTSTVLGIAIANTSGVSVLVGVGITRTTEDDVNLLKNVPIPQGSTLEFVEGNKIVLEAEDTVTAYSDADASVKELVGAVGGLGGGTLGEGLGTGGRLPPCSYWWR